MANNLSDVLRGGKSGDLALIEATDAGVRTFTYGELNDQVNALGRGFRARFGGAPFKVAVLARNSADYVVIYFAAMRAGGTVVPFNWRASDEAIDFFLRDAGIDLVLTDDAERHGRRDGAILIGSSAWAALQDPGPLEPAEVSDTDIAQILYTSGSTGTPKGVPLSHAGQYWAVEEGAKLITDPASYRVLVAAPLFHMNALFNIKRTFFTGGSVVVLPGFTPAGFARAVDIFRCDWVSGVPTMIAMLARHLGDAVPRAFAGVRFLFIGSAPYGDNLVAEARRLFPNAEIANFYGTTEAGPTVYGRHPDGRPSPALSCGYPLFPENLRLVGADGALVTGEGEGTLHMRTPATMPGYLNRPETNAAVLRDGWYDSRDIIRQDADGFHYFVGRADDMFISGGHNIYPAEVERVLEQHPVIEQAVVVPVPDDLKHEVPAAFVVTRGGVPLDEAAVKAWFVEQADPYLHPRHIFAVPEIPLAQTNKIDRSRLKAEAADRTGRNKAA
ncbi:acetyl-CoA synthetase [Azorhizobium oxalatiphilum]|uniref:Acetyl-CoA synthetase n=1 Tax=Azorhizobium oxalatiphilum TaxID=980631 RepID=A0A917BV66_9HYPH|nr:class I adenylate-forming enzyme family protein [Azorhizobium oxalatiphilum]GGF58602.1 acetyl-CoA synthetase [Azorhizobium oxalatiphilum]